MEKGHVRDLQLITYVRVSMFLAVVVGVLLVAIFQARVSNGLVIVMFFAFLLQLIIIALIDAGFRKTGSVSWSPEAGGRRSVPTKSYLCRNCGYLEFFVAKETIETEIEGREKGIL